MLEKEAAMKELLKERRRTNVEECRSTVVVEGGLLRKQQCGLEATQRRVTSFVSEVGVHQKDTEEGQTSLSRRRRRKKRAVAREGSAERQDDVSAHPLTSHLEQNVEAED